MITESLVNGVAMKMDVLLCSYVFVRYVYIALRLFVLNEPAVR
jgi:hypothetical protein